MAERARLPPRRLRRAVILLALVLLATAAAAYRLELPDRLGTASPGPVTEPAAVAPPAGLQLPPYPTARPVAAPLSDPGLDPRAVRRALGRLPDAGRLGSRVALEVATLDGQVVHRRGPRVVIPASTLKLATAAAALVRLGPEHRFRTRVVRSGSRLTLVGGGDPTLTRRPPQPGSYPAQADLTTLAAQTARRLRRLSLTRVELTYDASLFVGPAASPTWEEDYLPDDVVSPISALWVDEGRKRTGLAARSSDPARDAARIFASALRARDVQLAGTPKPRQAAAGATLLAEVTSAELVEVVQHVLEVSDNEGAELLARHVALAQGQPASFAGAGRAVSEVLDELGVELAGAVIHDGSGLSRSDRLRPRAVTRLLSLAATPGRSGHPELAGLVEGLPVAGFSGSLTDRFAATRAAAGLGYVRAKTGTLTGVSGLAGLVTGSDGSVMVFVVIADNMPVPTTSFARDRLDQIASALANCSCGRRPPS